MVITVSATLVDPARGQYRYSELEPQKVDSSGRQFYLEARCKFKRPARGRPPDRAGA